MKHILVYRAYQLLVKAPCHDTLFPILGEFFVTQSTYSIIRKLHNNEKLPNFVKVIPNAALRPNLGELDYVDSVPRNYIRVFLTDYEKERRTGTINKTVWECFENLLSIYALNEGNHLCQRHPSMHMYCLQNLIKSVARDANVPCPALDGIRQKFNVC